MPQQNTGGSQQGLFSPAPMQSMVHMCFRPEYNINNLGVCCPKRKKGVNKLTGWLIRWALNVVAIIFTAYIINGFEVTVAGAIFGSIILGIINAIIRPVILILTLPINIITLGLFTLVVNGLMLWLTSSMIKGFDITGFGIAIIVALVLSIFSFIISYLVKD